MSAAAEMAAAAAAAAAEYVCRFLKDLDEAVHELRSSAGDRRT
jgi:hypothetical protein